jgi:hypothetical protein
MDINNNAKSIMTEANYIIAFSENEFPPSKIMIECYVDAVKLLNKNITKRWESAEEFMNDMKIIHSVIIGYKKESLASWYLYLLNLGGSTWGTLQRTHYINNIFDDIQRPLSRNEAINLGVKTFYRILKYQAQLDGNTRLASIIANLIFLRNGLPPFILDTTNASKYYTLTSDIRYGNFYFNFRDRIINIFFPNELNSDL